MLFVNYERFRDVKNGNLVLEQTGESTWSGDLNLKVKPSKLCNIKYNKIVLLNVVFPTNSNVTLKNIN